MSRRRITEDTLSRGAGWTDLASIVLCGFCVSLTCLPKQKLNGKGIHNSGRICWKTDSLVFSFQFTSDTAPPLKTPTLILRESKPLCRPKDRWAYCASRTNNLAKSKFSTGEKRNLYHPPHPNLSSFRTEKLLLKQKKSAKKGRFFHFQNQELSPWFIYSYSKSVVTALLKVEILKANHNYLKVM